MTTVEPLPATQIPALTTPPIAPAPHMEQTMAGFSLRWMLITTILIGLFTARETYLLLSDNLAPLAYLLPSREYIYYMDAERSLRYSPESFIIRKTEGALNSTSELSFNTDDYVRSIPSVISNMHELSTLYITDNPIYSIPEFIGSLTKLQSVYINNTYVSSLPKNIGNLHNLTELSISGSRLSSLPESIGNLKNLQALNLSYNRLTTLPDNIGNLSSLVVLDLTGNNIRSLPRQLPPLLERLYMGGNPMSIQDLETLQKANATSDLTIYY